MHLPVGLGTALGQRFHETLPISVVLKARLPQITPIHHVVNRTGIFHSGLTRHGPEAVPHRLDISKNQEPTPFLSFFLERAFRVLGLKQQSVALSGSAPEKVVLAWWLRRRTTVSLRWVSQRLCMGHYTRVTQAVSRAERRPGRKLNQIKRKLGAVGNAAAG